MKLVAVAVTVPARGSIQVFRLRPSKAFDSASPCFVLGALH